MLISNGNQSGPSHIFTLGWNLHRRECSVDCSFQGSRRRSGSKLEHLAGIRSHLRLACSLHRWLLNYRRNDTFGQRWGPFAGTIGFVPGEDVMVLDAFADPKGLYLAGLLITTDQGNVLHVFGKPVGQHFSATSVESGILAGFSVAATRSIVKYQPQPCSVPV